MTPFELGYKAFLEGQPAESNPYDKESSPWSLKQWAKGWKSAQTKRASELR